MSSFYKTTRLGFLLDCFDILILKTPKTPRSDEAPSALDAESERVAQDALDQVMAGIGYLQSRMQMLLQRLKMEWKASMVLWPIPEMASSLNISASTAQLIRLNTCHYSVTSFSNDGLFIFSLFTPVVFL